MVCGTAFEIVDASQALSAIAAGAARHIDEDAYIEAKLGNAVCLQAPDGLVVLSLWPLGNGRMRAFVLMAVSRAAHGAYQRNERAIMAIARDMGADVLAFRSKRRGWARVLGRDWRQVDDDTWERSL